MYLKISVFKYYADMQAKSVGFVECCFMILHTQYVTKNADADADLMKKRHVHLLIVIVMKTPEHRTIIKWNGLHFMQSIFIIIRVRLHYFR